MRVRGLYVAISSSQFGSRSESERRFRGRTCGSIEGRQGSSEEAQPRELFVSSPKMGYMDPSCSGLAPRPLKAAELVCAPQIA